MLLRSMYWLCGQLGVDPRRTVRGLRGLPRFLRDYRRFRAGYAGRLDLLPCLHEWHEEGGAVRNEYFWQDLLVARMIFAARPERHVDIGSRVDGFVAHVAGFREIEVFDIRPITARVPGVTFRQLDVMQSLAAMAGYCDSVSCLHALEHFGLGRYGDPLDPSGFVRGIGNMARLLRNGGVLYLSVPIGVDRVEFNAHRVFDPRTIVSTAVAQSLNLAALTVIERDGRVSEIADPASHLEALAQQWYALGVFTFRKGVVHS